MKFKIAVPVNESEIIEGHFGHSREFMFFTVDEGLVVSTEKKTPPPHAPGVIPRWIRDNEVTDVIVGGIGQNAIRILEYNQIVIHKGASEKHAQFLVNELLNGTLELKPENCDHHHHHEHEHGHGYKHSHN